MVKKPKEHERRDARQVGDAECVARRAWLVPAFGYHESESLRSGSCRCDYARMALAPPEEDAEKPRGVLASAALCCALVSTS